MDLGNVGDKPENRVSMYSPKSVVEAMKRHSFGTYWNQTETYEALQNYIKMNFEGLKDDVVIMLAGGNVKININKFANDMTNLNSKDDVFTLLIHLGYLTYDKKTETVKIPNKEVTCEYLNVLEDSSQWGNVIKAIENSRNLLLDLWNREEKR